MALQARSYENTPAWKQSHQFFGTDQGAFGAYGVSPLHWWQTGNYDGPAVAEFFNANVTASGVAPWQHDFLLLELGRGVEMGVTQAQALFAWTGEGLIGKLTEPTYPIAVVGIYVEPAQKLPNWAWFTSWKEVITGFSDAMLTRPATGYWPNTGGETFWDVERGAMGVAASSPVEQRRGSGSRTGSPNERRHRSGAELER